MLAPAFFFALSLANDLNSILNATHKHKHPFCADDASGAGELPPPAITIDGSLDDVAWQEVAFTRSNPDICGDETFCPTTGDQSSKCVALSLPHVVHSPLLFNAHTSRVVGASWLACILGEKQQLYNRSMGYQLL